MRAALAYILSTVLALVLIWGVLRIGNRLSASPALQKDWVVSFTEVAPSCKIPLEQTLHTLQMRLDQSGESIVWKEDDPHAHRREEPLLHLQGKINRDGSFDLSGTLNDPQYEESCGKIYLSWRGKKIKEVLRGQVKFISEQCALCPEGTTWVASPRLHSEGVGVSPSIYSIGE